MDIGSSEGRGARAEEEGPGTPTVAGQDVRAVVPSGHLETGPDDCDLGYPLGPAQCDTCGDYLAGVSAAERTRCEVWTRVMGYRRPVSAFNAGKQAEHRERLAFREQPSGRQVPSHRLAEGAGHD